MFVIGITVSGSANRRTLTSSYGPRAAYNRSNATNSPVQNTVPAPVQYQQSGGGLGSQSNKSRAHVVSVNDPVADGFSDIIPDGPPTFTVEV